MSMNKDHAYDEKLNRSLASHTLDSLVFEKRVRKSVWNPLPIVPQKEKKTPKRLIKGKPIKKIQKRVRKEPSPSVDSEDDSQPQLQEQPLQKEVSSSNKIDLSADAGEAELQIVSQPVKRKRGRPRKSSVLNKVAKEQSSKQEQEQSQQVAQVSATEPTSIIEKPLLQASSLRIEEELGREGEEEISKANDKEIGCQAKLKSLLKDKSTRKRLELKGLMQIDWMSDTRMRQAKLNSVNRYNDDDQFDDPDEESYETEKYQRRKKTNKAAKDVSKPYCLNRIFRKSKKQQFPTFVLDVDLVQLNLGILAAQMGQFDLIHCSLPIEFLSTLAQQDKLLEKGFMFLWAQKGELQAGYHLLNRWGYDVVDQIVWVKVNPQESTVVFDEAKVDEHQLFLNCHSTCLVGYKCPTGKKAQYHTKISNNIIFAACQGNRKPQEIYQIADLMMPGAKKLELGRHSVPGWFTLRHQERSLYRCKLCFRRANISLVREARCFYPYCHSCLVLQRTTEGKEGRTAEKRNWSFETKIPILETIVSAFQQQRCSRCEGRNKNTALEGLIQVNVQEAICSTCFVECAHSLSGLEMGVSVIQPRLLLLNSLKSDCSKCHIQYLCDFYFECMKCPSQKLCQTCFWKIQSDAQSTKKFIQHEWKLRQVRQVPFLRCSCFSCKSELDIPYWCCETCQNWVWCGRCQVVEKENHPHSQAQHVTYLMV